MTRIPLYIRSALSIGLLVFLASIFDWETVKTLSLDIISVIISGAMIFFTSLCIMSFRWKLILDHEIHNPSDYIILLRYYLIAQYFNIFLPGSIGGDAVRASYCNKLYNTGLKRIVAVVFSERVFGLSAMAFIVSFGFVFNSRILEKLFLGRELGLLLIAFSIATFFIARYFATKKAHVTIPIAILLLFISGLAQCGDVIITYILVQYLDLDVLFVDLLIIIPVVYVATILPISIGGLGVREGVMAGLLGLFGVATSKAILIAFALYLAKIVIGCCGGVLYLKEDKIRTEDIALALKEN